MGESSVHSGSVRYCGREYTAAELVIIREIIADRERNPTRSAISRAVCARLDLRQANGKLKDVSCRVALKRMHEDGLIELPPPQDGPPRRVTPELTSASARGEPIVGSAGDLEAVHLRRVNSKADSRLWNELVARYHYLGYRRLVGAQLRYLALDGDRLLGLLGFGASAWKVGPRDEFIGWTESERKAHLHLVVNNARFLILPWVRVKNLASHLLSLAAKKLVDDWLRIYNYQPVLLETFVDECFLGTSYRAANWIFLGQTTGRGKKQGRGRRRRDFPIKSIFVYPLCRDFRRLLGVER